MKVVVLALALLVPSSAFAQNAGPDPGAVRGAAKDPIPPPKEANASGPQNGDHGGAPAPRDPGGVRGADKDPAPPKANAQTANAKDGESPRQDKQASRGDNAKARKRRPPSKGNSQDSGGVAGMPVDPSPPATPKVKKPTGASDQ